MKTRTGLFLLCIAVALTLAACDGSVEAVEYGDPAPFAGVWYSGEIDGRAFVFHENGEYEWYSVVFGNEPQLEHTGNFKPRDNRINISMERSDKPEDFSIWYQFYIEDSETIESVGSDRVTYSRISNAPDEDVLRELTEMLVPMEAYIGDWESDSVLAKMSITETEYEITRGYSVSSGDIIKGRDCLLIGMDHLRLTATEDGGLVLDGTDGVFYPLGSEKAAGAPHKAFVGSWSNETGGDQIQFTDDGQYVIAYGSVNDDGSFSAGMGSGGFEMRGDTLIYEHDDIEHTASIDNGVMSISGIDGVFEKN